jgi:hypothetical protein
MASNGFTITLDWKTNGFAKTPWFTVGFNRYTSAAEL